MLIVLNGAYQVITTSDTTIAQGDSSLGKLQIVAPIATAVSAAFVLPNGTVTAELPTARASSSGNLYIYSLMSDSSVFAAIPGKVSVQIYSYYNDGNGVSHKAATTPIEFNVIRGVSAIPTDPADVDTWAQMLSEITSLSGEVETIASTSVQLLENTQQYNMWTLATGYYKVEKDTNIFLTEAHTNPLRNGTDDMVLFVQNNSLLKASFVGVSANKSTDNKPKMFYGYTDGTNSSLNEFKFEDYSTTAQVQSMIATAVTDELNTEV